MMSLKIAAQSESFVPVPINMFDVIQSHKEGKGSRFSTVSDERTLLPVTNFLYSLSLLSLSTFIDSILGPANSNTFSTLSGEIGDFATKFIRSPRR